MNTAVTTSQTFEEKLKTRIRESMGDLMSDDDLKKLVEAGVADILFKTRTVRDDNRYGSGIKSEPPLLQTILTPIIEGMAKKAITEWTKAPENQEVILASLKESMGRGLADAVMRAFDEKFNSAFFTLQQQLRQSMGLPS